MLMMKLKVYYEDAENNESSTGGWEIVSITKLIWWILNKRIKPKNSVKSTKYFIRKIETLDGKRI